MLIVTGTVSQTRKVAFANGDATFLELISKSPNRQTLIYEIRLADDMPPDQFTEGTEVSLAVSVGAKNNRACFSALRTQPDGYPKVTPVD
ncbi:MAG: hypothetical protein R3D67_21150 [Hyphomicrobiaceae bacterium]